MISARPHGQRVPHGVEPTIAEERDGYLTCFSVGMCGDLRRALRESLAGNHEVAAAKGFSCRKFGAETKELARRGEKLKAGLM